MRESGALETLTRHREEQFLTPIRMKKLKNMENFLVVKNRLPKNVLDFSGHFTIANSIVNAHHFHQRIREGNLYGFGPKSEGSSEFFIHF